MSSSDTAKLPRRESAGAPAGRNPVFVTTHWSVVITAGRDTPRARAALENLCQTYWFPLYAYVRRRGYSPDDARDLTQEFFARMLQRHSVSTVHPDRGRFRSFLLASMNHFLADEWDKARAEKRGGGHVISLNLQNAETQLGQCADPQLTPERAFELKWAIALLEEVYRKLETEHQVEGKGEIFSVLRMAVAGASSAAPYAELARQLDISEGAVKVAVHRLRKRYRELLRETIADTVATPAEVEDELRHLMRVLGRQT